MVGVVLNPAVFFAYHVLWPQGFTGPFTPRAPFAGFEWFSALIGSATFVALFRYKLGIIPVILACGGAGLVYTLLRP